MQIHEVASLFPLMTEDEFRALKADVAANGLREPIWTYQGKVIDGRNRIRACDDLEIQPQFREWDGKGSLVAFVLSVNLHRRHMTPSQRAALAAEIEPMLAKEAKERQRASGPESAKKRQEKKNGSVVAELPQPSKEPKSRDEAAKATGSSPRYVQQAKAVKEKAPELFEKVRKGEVPLAQATRQVERQEKIQALEDKAKEADKTPPSAEPTWRIINGDCVRELQQIEAGTVRLIFADPPYNIGIDYGEGTNADSLSDPDYLEWVANWIRFCGRALTEDGSLWVLIGDEYAAEYGVILKRHGFTLRAWIKWYETFGVNQANNFNRCSRHLFYCVKNPKQFVFNAAAVNRPSDRQTKYGDTRADPGGKIWDDVWQIPRLVGTAKERIPEFPTQLPLELLRPIIGCASDPSDLVLDPFCGSGSTGAACLELGRRFIGIEKSARFHELATMRMKAHAKETQT